MWLWASIEHINEIESMTLTHEIDQDEIRAGIEKLAPLSIYIQIRQIAITFSKSINEVRKWKYSECFTELVTQKRLSDYEKELFEIKRKKD